MTRDGDVVLTFHRRADVEEDVREVVERESACCAFFTFDIDVEDDHIEVRVTAPDDEAGYLEALYRATDPTTTPAGNDTANDHSS